MKKAIKFSSSDPDFRKNQIASKSGIQKIGTSLCKITLFVIFSCSLFTSQSQAQHVRIFNTENSGLPNNEVTSIAIDAQGIKWFGTNDGQVAKFDGINWTVYNNTNSILPVNYPITSITIDKQNNKWIGTYLIYSDPNGLVIGTDGGLFKFDDSNWTIYNNTNSGLPNNSISAISVDKDGNKWIATRNGLAKFDNLHWTVYNKDNSELPNDEVTAITIDGLGNKWIGTSIGAVAKFNDSNWTVYNSSLPRINGINSIAIDDEGKKWFGGTSDWHLGLNGGGLAVFDDTNWAFYNSDNSSLPYNSVTAIAIDGLGNKWLGTYLPELYFYGGVVKFDGTNWVIYEGTNSVLPVDYIYSIVIDDKGNKWFGTWLSGVVVYNENGLTTGLNDKLTETSDDYHVYPNPAKDFVTVDGLQTGTIEIFNSVGVILIKSEVQGTLKKLDISNLPGGIYTIRATTNDIVLAKKFVKEY